LSAGPTRAGVAEFVGDNSCRSVLGERIGVLAGLAEPAGTVTGPGSGAVRMSGRVSSTGSRCGGESGGDGWWVAGGGAGVLADGAGVADRGPGDEVQELAASSDCVGPLSQHGVVEEPVAGLCAVAAAVEAVVIGVTGWDGPEVFFAVEPGGDVVGGLVEAEADGPASRCELPRRSPGRGTHSLLSRTRGLASGSQ